MLKELNDVEFLKKISNDIEQLNKIIIDTQGFVLKKLEENKIFPDINLLLNDLDNYKIKFLVENYNLNAEQSIKIAAFTNKKILNMVKKQPNNISLSEEDIILYLKKGSVFPPNILLSSDMIKRNEEFLISLDGNYDDSFYNILKGSFMNFTDKEIIENEKFIMHNPSVINTSNLLTTGRKVSRDLFRKAILKNKNKNLTMSQFQNYEFDLEDKQLLINLIKKEENTVWPKFHKSYLQFISYKGVEDIIDKYEFFELVKNYNFDGFTEEEVSKNIDFFHKVIIDRVYYDFFNFLTKLDIKKEIYQTLINKDLIIKISNNKTQNYNMSFEQSDYKDSFIFNFIHITSTLLKTIVEEKLYDNNIVNVMSDFLKEIEYIEKRKGEKLDLPESFNQNIYDFYKNILYDALDNENFFNLIRNRITDLNNVEIINKIYSDESRKGNNNFVSINGFMALVEIAGKVYPNDRKSIRELVTTIQKELLKNNTNEIYVKKILEKKINSRYIDDDYKVFLENLYKIKPKLLVKGKGLTNKEIKKNILYYENLDLQNTNEDLISMLYKYDNSILLKINEDKVLLNNSTMITILNDINKDDDKIKDKDFIINFLNEYINIHRDKVHNNKELIKYFFSNKNQKLFYNYENEDFDTLFEEMLIIEDKLSDIKIFNKKILDKYDFEDYHRKEKKEHFTIEKLNDLINKIKNHDLSNKDKSYDLYVNLENVLSSKYDYVKEFIGSVSYDFLNKKIVKMIHEHDFKSLKKLEENNILNPHISELYKYINQVDFQTLVKLFEDDDFCRFVKNSLSYEGKTEIKFKNFTKKENIIIANKLIDYFEDKFNRNISRVFNFFDVNNRGFIKDFAIEKLPLEMVYGYNFMQKQENKYIQTAFTTDELIKIFENIEKKDGFFSYIDVNASYDHFFRSAIFKKRGDENEMKKYLDLLEKAKKHPKFYAILSYESIFKDGLVWGKNYDNDTEYKHKSSDEAVNDFFVNNFDFDIILEGLNQIVTEIEDKSKKTFLTEDGEEINTINTKVANAVIMRVIHNTYYESYNPNDYTDRTYCSYLNEEKTLKLMKFLYERTPSFLIERHVIGAAKDISEFFAKHIENFMNLKNIENLIIPEQNKVNEYFRLSDNNPASTRCEKLIYSIVNKMMDNKDIESLKYIENIFSQYKFISEEFEYGKVSETYKDKNIEILEIMLEKPFIEDIKKIIDKIELEKILTPKINKPQKVSKV